MQNVSYLKQRLLIFLQVKLCLVLHTSDVCKHIKKTILLLSYRMAQKIELQTLVRIFTIDGFYSFTFRPRKQFCNLNIYDMSHRP